MEYKHRLNAIRDRAARIRVPLVDLCGVARVNPSTFYRWAQDDANPRLRTLLRALDRMDAELAARERALLADLGAGER